MCTIFAIAGVLVAASSGGRPVHQPIAAEAVAGSMLRAWVNMKGAELASP
jgi:hypothetical protein